MVNPAASDNQITLTSWDGRKELLTGERDELRFDVRGGLFLARGGDLVDYTDPYGDGTPVTYETGTWTSPVVEVGYPIKQAVPSWNADTPTGTWVETEFRGRKADGTWTKWFVMGRWASGDDFAPADGRVGDIHRTSLNGQGDTDAALFTDTFVSKAGFEPDAFQTRARLYRPEGARVSPRLSSLSTMTSENLPDAHYTGTSDFTLGREVSLDVPQYQPEHPPRRVPRVRGRRPGVVLADVVHDGHLLLRTRGSGRGAGGHRRAQRRPAGRLRRDQHLGLRVRGCGQLAVQRRLRQHVRAEVVRDPAALPRGGREVHRGGYPAHLLDQLRRGGDARGRLQHPGHLVVLVGFTADGDPIINDPNKASNEEVRQVYTRENFERVWQTSTDGVTYVYHPKNVKLPRNMPGVTQNW